LSVSSAVVSAFVLGLAVAGTSGQVGVSDPADERVPASSFESILGNEDRVVRRVGGVEIRSSDVYHTLELSTPGVVGEAINELVLMTLVRLAAKEEGVDVPSAELEIAVDRTLSEQRARFVLEVSADLTLEEFVAQRHGWTPEEFRGQIRHGTLGNMLLDRVVRLSQWRTARDELQIILVEDESVANEIGDKLAQGASFTVLARNHSTHSSGAEGGYMPLLPADLEVPLVAGRAVLLVGEYLGPAPISLGDRDYWRFVRLVDRKQAVTGDWAALRDQVEADLARSPLHGDELALFEAAMAGRYGVSSPASPP
jgi:hypothetical protein